MYLLGILMTVIIVSQETDSFNKRFGWHSPISSKSTEFDSSSSVAAELLQGHNYFNRRSFQLNSGEISFTSHVRDDDSTRRNRKLREYSTEDVVRCLDSMSQIRNWRPMHIAFVGDSTIRQHFFSFLQRVPDHDRKMVHSSTKSGLYHFHEDRNVTSRLLHDLRISFYWRNLIQDDLIADFKRWASTDDESQVPDFILLGVTAHHISRTNVNNSLETYETLLERDLMPLINQSLTIHPHQEIVWLRQSPTGADRFHREIDAETIIMYNTVIHRIFRDTRIVIWDSLNAVVEEYLRGCALMRYDRRDPPRYVNCYDTIHPGMAALSIGTQLIINHMCQSFV